MTITATAGARANSEKNPKNTNNKAKYGITFIKHFVLRNKYIGAKSARRGQKAPEQRLQNRYKSLINKNKNQIKRESSELLGVSLRTIQLWVDAKHLEAWKIPGGHRRITHSSVENLFNKRTQPTRLERETHSEAPPDLAPHPIIGVENSILGYDLYPIEDPFSDKKFATLAISKAIEEFGILGAISTRACIIPLGDALLTDELAKSLEPGRLTFTLSPEKLSDPTIQARSVSLKQGGFRILLDLTSPRELSENVLRLTNFSVFIFPTPLAETLESGNSHHVGTLTRQLGIRREDLLRGIVESLGWSNALAQTD